LQVKAITVAFAPLFFAKLTSLPSTPSAVKSGADAPNSNSAAFEIDEAEVIENVAVAASNKPKQKRRFMIVWPLVIRRVLTIHPILKWMTP
jgi:hypothetical protein